MATPRLSHFEQQKLDLFMRLFLPHKPGERRRALVQTKTSGYTISKHHEGVIHELGARAFNQMYPELSFGGM